MSDQKFQLYVQRGPEPGKVYPLSSVSITIGRDPMADITISDPEVSRQHVRLIGTLSGYKIQDLGSTNGTYVDGVRLGGEAVELSTGQIITMGAGVALRFQTETDDQAGMATMLDGRFLPVDSEHLESSNPSQPVEAGGEPSVVSEISSPELGPPQDWQPAKEDSPRGQVGDDGPLMGEVSQDNISGQERYGAWDEDLESQAEQEIKSYGIGNEPIIIPQQGEAKTGEQPTADTPYWRKPSIIVALILLIICCCCSFFLFMYMYGGDWMLRQIGLLP